MSYARVLILIVSMIGCIEARRPQPDEVDGSDDANVGDMRSDGMDLTDGAAHDMRLNDQGSLDMSGDSSVPNQCHAFEWRGSVFDCTVNLCTEPFRGDITLRIACCECDLRRYCAPCDIQGAPVPD